MSDRADEIFGDENVKDVMFAELDRARQQHDKYEDQIEAAGEVLRRWFKVEKS